MDLVRDVLDKQVVDRNQTKMGKVDGIVLELREGEPPRVAFAELGAVVLARRIGPRVGPRIGRWVSRTAARLGGERHREPFRIPWRKVRDVGIDVEVDIDVNETRVFDWQNWLRDRVIARIPGA